jgi:hypothetical protein
MAWPAAGLRHFDRREFADPDRLSPALLELIDEIRERAGVPIRITSDYRSQEEHESIYPDPASRPDSPHTRGTGLDFVPVPFSAHNRLLILQAITSIYTEGKAPTLGLEIANRHFHIDVDNVLRRPWLWLGTSK